MFVLAGIDSYVKLLTVRFIVPYLLHYPVIYQKRQARCTALSVWNVVKDHRRLTFGKLRCFPKASAKVRQILEPANYLRDFFKKVEKKLITQFLHAQLSQLIAKNYKINKTSSCTASSKTPIIKGTFIGSTQTLHRYCSAKVCIIFQKQKQFDFFSLKNAKSFIFLK